MKIINQICEAIFIFTGIVTICTAILSFFSGSLYWVMSGDTLFALPIVGRIIKYSAAMVGIMLISHVLGKITEGKDDDDDEKTD